MWWDLHCNVQFEAFQQCIPIIRMQVPDHTIKDITGASFAGFYYICFQKSTSQVEGYYFHRNSEWSVRRGFESCNLTFCTVNWEICN